MQDGPQAALLPEWQWEKRFQRWWHRRAREIGEFCAEKRVFL
jgi:hypothetical protein